MFKRFTDRARRVMAFANQEAKEFKCECVGTEHILVGLIKEGDGIGHASLDLCDVTLSAIRRESKKLVRGKVCLSNLSLGHRAKRVMEYAIEEARNLGHDYVGTEHLLLGVLREHQGVGAQILMNLGYKLDDIRNKVLGLLGLLGQGGVKSIVLSSIYKSSLYCLGETNSIDKAMSFIRHMRLEYRTTCIALRSLEEEMTIYVLSEDNHCLDFQIGRDVFNAFMAGAELEGE